MPQDEPQMLHNRVFNRQLWTFLCNDLDSCLMVADEVQEKGDNSRFKGALYFPAALTLFAAIELAASYYAGDEPTGDRVAEFISKYIGPCSPELASKTVAKKWYEVFRNGLTHQWSPKAGGVGVFQWREVFRFLSEGLTEKSPYLNVPALFDAFKKALRAYESDLDSNLILRKNFDSRHKALESSDCNEMRIFRGLCGE